MMNKILEFLIKIPFYVSLIASAILAARFVNVVMADLGAPWKYLFGMFFFVLSHWIINGLIFNCFLLRPFINKYIPEFWYEECKAYFGFKDDCIELPWESLLRIEILTNDKGPFDEDLFWLFHLNGECDPIVMPHCTRGNEKIFEILPKFFENVNMEELGKAMGSCTNATFTIWVK